MNARVADASGLRDLATIWEDELLGARALGMDREARQRLVELYLQIIGAASTHAVRADFVRRLLARHTEVPIDATVLEEAAEIARGHGDADGARLVLEALAADPREDVRTRALEALGDLFADLGDRRAAVESWKPAARIRLGSAAAHAHACRLYERVLDTMPDGEAAERLAQLYVDANAWERIPEAVAIVVRFDAERGAKLVLGLERSARIAAAFEAFVAMADEAAALLAPSSPSARPLRRARARAIARIPSRQEDAREAYRGLLEAFGHDEDRREYQALVDASENAAAQREERRWLYRWRADHEERPLDALVEWVSYEEREGTTEEAVAAFLRVFDAARSGERPVVAAKIARALAALGREEDALAYLAPLLAAEAPSREAEVTAREMLADWTFGAAVAEHLERLAERVDDASAVRLLAFLLAALDETSAMPGARRRWYRRVASLGRSADLALILEGAVEAEDETLLWDVAERLARADGRQTEVAYACARVLREGPLEATVAEALGKRMMALDEERAIDSAVFVEALERVLDAAPCARWAIDRVKLALGAQGRWDALFAMYDRAVAAATETEARAELLQEAAFAARDLEGAPERAIDYFVRLRAIRPDGAAAALERLYERCDRKQELVLLLAERTQQAEGPERTDLQRRVAALWLDLAAPGKAADVLDDLLDAGADVDSLIELLERVASAAEKPRAAERLAAHYAREGRLADVVRVAERALPKVNANDASDAATRTSLVRRLVRARLRMAEGAPDEVARALVRVASDVGATAQLGVVAYRTALVYAMAQRRRATTDDEFEAALSLTWTAVDRLAALFVAAGGPGRAATLLERAAALAFDAGRQRALLHRAALASADAPEEDERTLRLFGRLFDGHVSDAIACASLDRFTALLDAAGRHAQLARVWEAQAHARANDEDACGERACWERAALAWKRALERGKAIGAHERAAALGSEESHEALARAFVAEEAWSDAARALEWLHARASGVARAERAAALSDAYVALGRHDAARKCLEEARPEAEGEAARGVRRRLIAIYRQQGAWRSLVEVLAAEAADTDDHAARAALNAQAAAVHRERLGEPEEAAHALERALAATPDDGELLLALAELLAERGAWDRVVGLLTAHVALGAKRRSRERAHLHHRLARALLCADRARDALAQLETARALHPSHHAILGDLARVSLALGEVDVAERSYRTLLLAMRKPEDASEEHGGASEVISPARVLLELGGIARSKGEVARAASLLESSFEEAAERRDDVDASARALRELCELWRDALGREAPLAARLRIHAAALAARARADAADSAWRTAWSVAALVETDAALLAMTGERIDAGERSREWLVEASALCLRLGDVALAGRVHDVLLEIDPLDADAWTGLERAAEVLQRAERFDEAAALLARRVGALAAGGAEHWDARFRLGHALERAGRREEAKCLYEEMLDGSSANPDALRTLEARLDATGSVRLADCLELRMTLEPAAARALAPRLLALRDAGGDEAAILRALELAFAADPTDRPLLDRLVRLYEAQWEWTATTRLLAAAFAVAPWDRALLVRLVDAHRATGAADDALELLNAAIAGAPADAELLLLRAAVHEARGDDAAAASDVSAADHTGDVDAKVEILTRIGLRSAPEVASGIAMQIVGLLVRAGRHGDARRALTALLVQAPERLDALEQLASLDKVAGAWGDAAATYKRIVGVLVRTPDRDARALPRAVLEFADACARADRPAAARETLERAIFVEPDDLDVARALERVCEATSDHARLSQLLAARAERTPDARERAQLLLRAANLLAQGGTVPDEALPHLERALVADPQNLDAALTYARAQLAFERPRQALAALAAVLEHDRRARSPALAAAHLELGKAHLALDELAEAFDALKAGFTMDPRSAELASLLGLVALDIGDARIAERALLAVTTLPQTEGSAALERSAAFYRLAELAYEHGDRVRARRWATKALAAHPGHAGVLALLGRMRSNEREESPRRIARGA